MRVSWKVAMLMVLGAVLLLGACDGASFTFVDLDGDEIEGSGTVVTEDRDVADFERVALAAEGTIVIRQGDEISLEIETDDNLMEYLDTAVSGRTLEIDLRERGLDLDPTGGIVYRITVPELDRVEITGAGTLLMEGFEADSFELDVPGAADVRITDLVATSLSVRIPGAADVDISGVVEEQAIRWSGAGSYDGRHLQSAVATVTISGAADVDIWATDRLDVSVSGAGSVDYFGSPDVHQQVTGIGTIRAGNA